MITTKQTPLEKLETKLNDGIVIFHYRKKNGEIRYAAGTLNPLIIPSNPANGSNSSLIQPLTQTTSPIKNGTFSYYDLLVSDWRSFKVDEFIKVQSSVKKI